MLHKFPLIWYLSVQHIFQMEYNTLCIVTAICFLLADITLKIYLLNDQTSRNPQKSRSGRDKFALQMIQQVMGGVMSIIISLVKSLTNQQSWRQLTMGMFVMVLQCVRFLEIYNSITIILITYKHKNYVNLFGFISKMFVILHLSAVVIYSATFLNPNDNWLKYIQRDHQETIVKYVYCLYFTAITMFTVGYGDVLPKNIPQIIMIILIQIFGIVLI